MKLNELNEFTRAYIIAALWTFDDESPSGDYESSGRPEKLFDKLASETAETMIREADAFQGIYGFLWRESGSFAPSPRPALLTDAQAGHDFWLTRNHHGAGFWDRGIGEAGDTLTKRAQEYGGRDLYFGDDGLIYIG